MRKNMRSGVKSSVFYDECWKVSVALIYSFRKGVIVNDLDILEFCKANGVNDYRIDNRPFAARTVEATHNNGSRCIIIALSDRSDKDVLSYLAHESFHAAEYILESKSIAHSPQTSEVFAYLLESIFNRCLAILTKK